MVLTMVSQSEGGCRREGDDRRFGEFAAASPATTAAPPPTADLGKLRQDEVGSGLGAESENHAYILEISTRHTTGPDSRYFHPKVPACSASN